ncbi:MAG: type II and III secretion system protein, partial [Azoarcus sp.]|nr:type II and III secretion system protein [Azoarcus sp.]
MMPSMASLAGLVLSALLAAGCAPATLSGGPSAGHLRAESAGGEAGARASIPEPVTREIPLPRPRSRGKTETYSVVVNGVEAQDLLFALARDGRLNVDIHPGIGGRVTLNAIDQTLPQLLERIARQIDMRFELDGPNLVVMPDSPYLKYYRADYVNLSREVAGTVWTNMQISTSALETSVGSRSGNVSRIQIDNASKNLFWESLEKNLKDLLLETDKIFPEGSSETTFEQDAGHRTFRADGAQKSGAANANGEPFGASGENALFQASALNQATTRSSGEIVMKRMTFREAASVIVNRETGVIAVRATSRQHEKLREFIERVMRGARRQVMIEATIIEVDLSDSYQQGIEWSKLAERTGFSLSPATNTQ